VCSFFFEIHWLTNEEEKKEKKGKEKETNVTWTRKDLHTDEHGGLLYIFPFSSFQPKKLLMWCATWWVGVPLCVLFPPHTHTHQNDHFFVVVGEGDPGSHNGSQPPNKRARYIPPQ
jgi:mannose-6-phosphate isomerase-like protein (cupin superfamily)